MVFLELNKRPVSSRDSWRHDLERAVTSQVSAADHVVSEDVKAEIPAGVSRPVSGKPGRDSRWFQRKVCSAAGICTRLSRYSDFHTVIHHTLMLKFDFHLLLSSMKTPAEANEWLNIYIGNEQLELLLFHDNKIVDIPKYHWCSSFYMRL